MADTCSRLAVARNELARADQKAGSLLSLSLASLAAGLTMAARGSLHIIVVLALWGAVVPLAAAVVLLTLAIRPRLDGDNGITAWARGECPDNDDDFALIWVSKAALRKHLHIRQAIMLLWIALAQAGFAALISALVS